MKWPAIKKLPISKDGYVRVVAPDYPGSYATGVVPEHRLVVANHLGRVIGNKEHIHHRNGDKSDNRIENLQVVSIKEHIDLHKGKRKREKRSYKMPVEPNNEFNKYKISEKIKLIRINLGWSQARLAKHLGKTIGQISRYENDSSIPPGDVLEAIYGLKSKIKNVTLEF